MIFWVILYFEQKRSSSLAENLLPVFQKFTLRGWRKILRRHKDFKATNVSQIVLGLAVKNFRAIGRKLFASFEAISFYLLSGTH